MKKKKNPSKKDKLRRSRQRRFVANQNLDKIFVGYFADSPLLQRFLIEDKILQPQIEDYTPTELKKGFAAYMEDLEAFWRDAFKSLDEGRNRVRTIPIAPVWSATSALFAHAFVLPSTRR